MEKRGIRTYEDLRRWSDENREQFWELLIEQLGVRFSRPPSHIMDPSSDVAADAYLHHDIYHRDHGAAGVTVYLFYTCLGAGVHDPE
jgi:hypothetical protein